MEPHMLKIRINSSLEPTVTLQEVNCSRFQMPIAPKPMGLTTQLKSKKFRFAQNEPYTLKNPKKFLLGARCDTTKSEFWPFSNACSS